jgi:hypothetical protein
VDDLRDIAAMNAQYMKFPSEVLYGMFWCRYIPDTAERALQAVCTHEHPTLEFILKWMTTDHVRYGMGAEAPVWDPPRTWTDDELRDHQDPYPPEPGDPTTAAEANAQEQAEHAEKIQKYDEYAASLGLPPIRTVLDVVHYLTACGLITVDSDEGEPRYRMNHTPRLPGEVLNLPQDELAKADQWRWARVHEPTTRRIISLFTNAAEQPSSKRTSLQRLARELGLDVETTRAGLAVLLQDDDFTATDDPETIAEHQVFEIHVDWDLFSSTRVQVRLATPDD